jgi:hypothetical protein
MNEFYKTPIIGPGRAPGDLLRRRPAFVRQLPGAMGARQILYLTGAPARGNACELAMGGFQDGTPVTEEPVETIMPGCEFRSAEHAGTVLTGREPSGPAAGSMTWRARP